MAVTVGGNHSQFAAVQVWGKGYRVTADSEEFQRYVPQNLPQPTSLEARLGSVSWGKVLESLYSLADREFTAQRCVLLDASELMTLSFARTEDRHRRPSLVLTTATVGIDWNSPALGDIASRTISLSSRLATAYAKTLKGNPEIVGQQLRTDAFLPSRSFDLNGEAPDLTVEWHQVLSAVKKWQGISGVSTPRLLSLGANVVLGTKYEAERAKQQFEVDGFFDVRDKDIKPLSPRLTPWEPAEELPPTPAPPSVGYPPVLDLRPITESLQSIARTFDRFADMAIQILEQALRDRRKR